MQCVHGISLHIRVCVRVCVRACAYKRIVHLRKTHGILYEIKKYKQYKRDVSFIVFVCVAVVVVANHVFDHIYCKSCIWLFCFFLFVMLHSHN